MKDTDRWIEEAACTGMRDLFFPPAYSESPRMRKKREIEALFICKSCPVMLQCRDYARQNSELGIWGGETEDQRWRGGFMFNNVVLTRRSRAYKKRQRSVSIDA